MPITTPELIEIYRISTFAKQLDDKVQQLVMSGEINTTWFSWRGSELLGAVVGKAMGPDDQMVAYYRDGMSQMAKGSSPKHLFAEAIGKVDGYQRGKSGWVHTVDYEAGVIMNSGVVGGQLPIAAGWALAAQMRSEDRVVVCNFGDGAANEGAFHEAVTLSVLWKLPIVWVCHNNLYSEHTSFDKTSPVPHVADRAVGYGLPGVTIDGNDVEAFWDQMKDALARARSGEGPTLIEAMTYRFRGHTRYDTMGYIAAGEVESHTSNDPVDRFRSRLIAEGRATAEALDEIDAAAAVEVEQTWAFARDSEYPAVEELLTDVYA